MSEEPACDETPKLAEKGWEMRQYSLGCAGIAFLVATIALAACQGNIGGGSGLSIPQAPGYQQPGGPAGAQTQSRQRVLDGAVYLSSKLTSVPLPQLGGFAISLALGSPGPVVAETASPAAGSGTKSAGALKGKAVKAGLLASPAATAAASASAAASGSPAAAASGSPAPGSSGSAAPSPGPSGSAAAVPAGSAAPGASAKATHAPSPSASGSSLPRIDTKLTIYPDDAPPPPTPMPTGEVQTFQKRGPVVRGYVQMGSDISLYGLGAIRFTVPATEMTPKRGWTIALYESGKHNHNKLLNYDTEPTATSGMVYSTLAESIVLKKGNGYLLMLYGDEEPAPIATVGPGYPSPGNNPFPTPSGNVQPGYTQVPGYATPYPGTTPYPGATPYPGTSTTPYNPFGTPHP